MTSDDSSCAIHKPLASNPNREAVATLRGYAYQVWISIDEWLRLPSDEVIFLEGAEDLDRVGVEEASATQVRDTKASISLNTSYGRKAIYQFWQMVSKEAYGRKVRFTYWTRSPVALEDNADFGGGTGIHTWSMARNSVESAESLQNYLVKNFRDDDSFLGFLQSADIGELQEKLFRAFVWLPGQPGTNAIKEAVLDRLAERLSTEYLVRNTLVKIRDHLFAFVWDQISKNTLSERVLTAAALSREIARATTFEIAVPIGTVAGFLNATMQMSSLQNSFSSLQLLVQSIPDLPVPLLERGALQRQLQNSLRSGESIFLTGSVHKGKTTIASIVATSICAEGWWVDLSSRDPGSVRDLCNLLALYVEQETAPLLIILDDLDTSLIAQRAYTKALQKLLHRSRVANKVVLITAQGSAPLLSADMRKNFDMTFLEIPSMSEAEIEEHCLQLSCPSSSLASRWSPLILRQTGGHPRMVYVRLLELAEAGWPPISSEDFLNASKGVMSVQQRARALLNETVSGAEADYVYTIAEFTTFPTREMLLNLADSMPNVHGAGDFLEKITGKWLEQISEMRVRATPILKVHAGLVWSENRRKTAHTAIHDAILRAKAKTPEDGAALVLHAFVGNCAERLKKVSAQFVILPNREAQREVFRHLTWLTMVSTEPGECIFPEATAAAALRHLQFHVAVAEGSSKVGKLALAWKSELRRLATSELAAFTQMFNLTLLTTPARIPARLLLDCAISFNDIKDTYEDLLKRQFRGMNQEAFSDKFPVNASSFQIFVALKSNMVQDFEDFVEVLQWLSSCDKSEILNEFDAVFEWPIVSTLGSFVHMGWVSEYKRDNPDWTRWECILRDASDTAEKKHLHRFGLEVSRAQSIIYCEYLRADESALDILKAAEKKFGKSAVLAEQRVNISYQRSRYEEGYEEWNGLISEFGKTNIYDPYAFRRAAVCAVAVGKIHEAAQIFEDGSAIFSSSVPTSGRASFFAEAALCYCLSGDHENATRLMLLCVDILPSVDIIKTSLEWEGALRFIFGIANQIKGKTAFLTNGSMLILNPGQASAPGLKADSLGGQFEMRLDILRIAVYAGELRFEASRAVALSKIKPYCHDPNFLVASSAYSELMQYFLHRGVDEDFVCAVAELAHHFCTLRARGPHGRELSGKEKREVLSSFLALGWLLSSSDDVLERFLRRAHALGIEPVVNTLEQIIGGFRMNAEAALTLVQEGSLSSTARIGASLSLLASKTTGASAICFSQALLLANFSRLGLLATLKDWDGDSRIIERLAPQWERLFGYSQSIHNPMLSIPFLKSEMKLARTNKGNLRNFLRAAGAAGNVNVDQVMHLL